MKLTKYVVRKEVYMKLNDLLDDDLLDDDLELSSAEKGVVVMLLFMLLCFYLIVFGLVFWGIGNLIFLVFGINATWHFWQGLIVGVIVAFIKMVV